MDKFVTLKNSRVPEQIEVMKKIIRNEECPFCLENLSKYHKKEIIRKGKFWILTENQWPYPNTKKQLLAIYKKHIEHISEVEPSAGKELLEMAKWATKKFKMRGGALAMRFGKSEFGDYGSTVLHLHAHLIEPDLKNKDGEAIKFKIGQPKDRKV